MYSSEHIWVMMARKLSNEASPSELAELEEYLRQHPEFNYSKEILQDVWNNKSSTNSQYAENRYKDLVQQMKNRGINKEIFIPTDHFIQPEETVKTTFLFKRRFLIIGTIAASMLAFIIILISKNSFELNSQIAEVQFKNEISTKIGSKSKLLLPDGTTVWLNSSSMLTYDKNYGNSIREVSLSGEAFFDVVKNANKPFIIHTAKLDIKVLGTAFNVKCYPGEKTTETSLIRGSIEVTLKDRQEKIKMKPNEKLVINNDEISTQNLVSSSTQSQTVIQKPIISLSHLSILKLDSTVVETAWVQNRLVFNGDTFEDIALKMERWYAVKITFTDESLKLKRFTGSFEKESVVEALEALQFSSPFVFSYQIKNDAIIISKHKNLNK